MIRKQSFLLSLGLVLAVLLMPSQAKAYIDPGSGSYVLQVVAASALGAVFAVKTYWGQLKTSIKGLFSKKQSDV